MFEETFHCVTRSVIKTLLYIKTRNIRLKMVYMKHVYRIVLSLKLVYKQLQWSVNYLLQFLYRDNFTSRHIVVFFFSNSNKRPSRWLLLQICLCIETISRVLNLIEKYIEYCKLNLSNLTKENGYQFEFRGMTI